MGWNDDYVVDLRGSESTDPTSTTGAHDVRIALAGIQPRLVTFGSILTTARKSLKGPNETRIEFGMKPKPFMVLAGARTDVQDHGYLWQLQKALGHTYVHILHLYKVGSDTGAGAIPRARLASGTTSDTFWSAEIAPPVTCVVEGQPKPTPSFENGWDTLDFTLVKAEAEV